MTGIHAHPLNFAVERVRRSVQTGLSTGLRLDLKCRLDNSPLMDRENNPLSRCDLTVLSEAAVRKMDNLPDEVSGKLFCAPELFHGWVGIEETALVRLWAVHSGSLEISSINLMAEIDASSMPPRWRSDSTSTDISSASIYLSEKPERPTRKSFFSRWIA